VKKKKEICVSFAVVLQTGNVTITVCGKFLNGIKFKHICKENNSVEGSYHVWFQTFKGTLVESKRAIGPILFGLELCLS
jgi:superfamily II RNA helicase